MKMKTKQYILSFAAMAMAFVAAAQSLPDKYVELSAASQTKRQAVSDIIMQTGYKVFYEGRSFNPQETIDFGQERLPLADVLSKLTKDAGLDYVVEGENIIIYQGKEKSERVAVIRNISGTVTDAEGVPLEGVVIEIMDIGGRVTTTVDGGRFTLANTPAGDHTLRITSADRKTVRFRKVTVPVGGDANVVLKLTQNPVAATPDSVPEAQNTSYFLQSTEAALKGANKSHVALIQVTPRTEDLYLPHTALKFNMLYALTTTINGSMEFGLGKRWTFDAAVAFNPFKLSHDGINRLWFVQPEFRWWTCQRFEGHFFGLHGIYGQFNIGRLDLLTTTFRNHIYKGSGIGAGVAWGYHRPLGGLWSLEFSLGAGFVHLNYDKYRCEGCDAHLGREAKNYFGPTKAAVSLIWMIR
jgi:hypothetical protein